MKFIQQRVEERGLFPADPTEVTVDLVYRMFGNVSDIFGGGVRDGQTL